MLAFRFCVVVSAGAMMILGYGVLGTSSAAIASTEVEENVVKRSTALPRAGLTPDAETTVSSDAVADSPSGVRPLSVDGITAISQVQSEDTDSSGAVSPVPNNLTPERQPQTQSEDTDASFSAPIIVVESNLPNTETVLNAFSQVITAAPDVQFSDFSEGNSQTTVSPTVSQNGNATEVLRRVNSAIANRQATPPQIVTQAPNSPPAASETVVVIESTLPDLQTVLSAFEAAATTSPEIKVSTYNSTDLLENGAIAADSENTPPTPLSSDNFTPFERILSHFRRQQPSPAVTATPPKPLTRENFTPFATVLAGRAQPEATTRLISSNDTAPDQPTLSNVLPETNTIVEAFKTVFGEIQASDLAVSPDETTATEVDPNASIIPTPDLETSESADAIAQSDSIIPTLEPETPATEEVEAVTEDTIEDSLTPNNQNPSTRELIENPQPASTLDTVAPTETLAPNVNPLLRPTERDDVNIDISEPITLEEAVALALRNNPTLRQTNLELNVARESLREALASEYPTVNTQFNFARTDSAQSGRAGNNNDSPLLDQLGVNPNDSTNTTAEGRLELSYNVYTGGRRSAQINAAERSVRLNQLEVERIAAETKFNTLRAYYAVQEANSRVQIEESAVADAERSLRDAQLLEEAGLGTRFDVLQAQVQLANNTQNLTNARSQQEVSQRELAVVLGLGQEVEVSAADAIEAAGTWDLSLEETLLLAYQNRAELEQSLVQREINEQQRQIALAGIKPQVSVFANYNVLGITGDDQGLGDGYTFGARMQWTLFDGGAAQARAAQQATNIEIAETQFDQQLDQIRLEVEQAYRSLLANQDNIQTASVALQLAQESLRLARLRFGAGVGTQTEVINAQTELSRARGNLLTAIIDYNRDLAALQRAVTNLPDNRLFDLPE